MTIGVDLGATNIRVGIVEGGVIYRKISEPFPYDKTFEETINFLISTIRRLMNTNIKGIGIGVPSVVDSRKGIVYKAGNVPSWKEVHLKDILEAEFKIQVRVNNDCNCFAFGERYYGECTPYRNIVGVTLGTGLGAGIVVNDVLYEGLNTGAGEIGLVPYLDSNYEHYCASKFFQRYKTTAHIAYLRAENDDKEALAMWEEFGHHIGNMIQVIMYMYDPEAIILGGGITKGYKYFSEGMNKNLANFPYPLALEKMHLLISSKEDISLLGAASLIP